MNSRGKRILTLARDLRLHACLSKFFFIILDVNFVINMGGSHEAVNLGELPPFLLPVFFGKQFLYPDLVNLPILKIIRVIILHDSL